MMAESARTSALAVANKFVRYGLEDGMPVEHLKLQKLVYYSFAWWAASCSDWLFADDIEAWRHGPVVRSVWKKFNKFESSLIDKIAPEFSILDGNIVEIYPEITDRQIASYLRKIWNTYNRFTGIQISNMTHSLDEPWHKIRILQTADNTPNIPFYLIKSSFESKLKTSYALLST